MKHLIGFCAVLSVLALTSCSKNVVGTDGHGFVQGMVADDGRPSVGAQILVLTDSGNDLEAQTDANGHFSFSVPAGESVAGVVAVRLLKSGSAAQPESDGSYTIELEDIPEPSTRAPTPELATQELWYGVYDTDGNGDVRFRYQYTFQRFQCVTWLPWLFMSTDPNRWTSWNLTDFAPTHKGKKLLVPRRYQTWHSKAYGFPIQQALVLIAAR